MIKANRVTKQDAQEILADERKFSKFILLNEKFLYKIVSSEVNKHSANHDDSELIEDAMNEARLSVWLKALPNYDGSTKFSTFSFFCIKNHVSQFLQKRSRTAKHLGEITSIEKFKRGNINDLGAGASEEYREDKWDRSKRNTFEDKLIQKIDYEVAAKQLSERDRIIIYLKMKDTPLLAMSKTIGMNIATFKQYYYGVFAKKLKACGIEI